MSLKNFKNIQEQVQKEDEALLPDHWTNAGAFMEKGQSAEMSDNLWSYVWPARVPYKQMDMLNEKNELIIAKPKIYPMTKIKCGTKANILIVKDAYPIIFHKVIIGQSKKTSYALTDYVRCNRWTIEPNNLGKDAKPEDTENECIFCKALNKYPHLPPLSRMMVIGIIDLSDVGAYNVSAKEVYDTIEGIPKLMFLDDNRTIPSFFKAITAARKDDRPICGTVFTTERSTDPKSYRLGEWSYESRYPSLNLKSRSEINPITNKPQDIYYTVDEFGGESVIFYDVCMDDAFPFLTGNAENIIPIDKQVQLAKSVLRVHLTNQFRMTPDKMSYDHDYTQELLGADYELIFKEKKEKSGEQAVDKATEQKSGNRFFGKSTQSTTSKSTQNTKSSNLDKLSEGAYEEDASEVFDGIDELGLSDMMSETQDNDEPPSLDVMKETMKDYSTLDEFFSDFYIRQYPEEYQEKIRAMWDIQTAKKKITKKK
jgi:hypothetical protein